MESKLAPVKRDEGETFCPREGLSWPISHGRWMHVFAALIPSATPSNTKAKGSSGEVAAGPGKYTRSHWQAMAGNCKGMATETTNNCKSNTARATSKKLQNNCECRLNGQRILEETHQHEEQPQIE
jgi:hypothetical protein